jgi:hypothetical protein
MFSETRYAMNGDLRVAYRTSREGPRDILFVSNWFTNCEVFPELAITRVIEHGFECATSIRHLDLVEAAGLPMRPGV